MDGGLSSVDIFTTFVFNESSHPITLHFFADECVTGHFSESTGAGARTGSNQ